MKNNYENSSITIYDNTTDNRMPLHSIEIPPLVLSPDYDGIFHAVEAEKACPQRDYFLHVRVIINNHHNIRGANVIIPLMPSDDILYHKYLDLRKRIRNEDLIFVTFSDMFVVGSPRPNEIYLLSHDFEIYDPNTTTDEETELPFPEI